LVEEVVIGYVEIVENSKTPLNYLIFEYKNMNFCVEKMLISKSNLSTETPTSK